MYYQWMQQNLFLCKNEVHMVFSNSKIEKSHGIQLLEWMKIEGYYQ